MRTTCKSMLTQFHRAWQACCNKWLPVLRMSPSGCPQIDYASILRRPSSSGWDHHDGSRTVLRTLKWTFWDLSFVHPVDSVRDLGVLIDSGLTLSDHVNKVAALCYFHIRQLRIMRRTLTYEVAHSLLRALIHNRIDYCNGILASSPKYLTEKLQSVLRVAARLVLRLPSHSPISASMRDQLHWLSVESRVKFKLAHLAYKSVHGLAPEYLSACCVPVSRLPGHSHLRSANQWTMFVPRTKTDNRPSGFLLFMP